MCYILHWKLVSWSRSCDKTETKTLTSKTEAKAKTPTFKTKGQAKAWRSHRGGTGSTCPL